jgi:hypothetical protein
MNRPVILLYPNGQREAVMLAGVPSVGHYIRLVNGVQSPSLVVEAVTWMEAAEGHVSPTVILSVRNATGPV